MLQFCPTSATERQPLLANSNLASFIDNKLIQQIPSEESNLHKNARRIIQVACIIAGFAGRIPFINMNLALAGNNLIIGGILSYGVCASFGYLVAYALLEIVNIQMEPRSPEEKALFESRTNPTLKKVFFAVAIFFGFLIQVPFAYIAYKYNSESFLNPKKLLMPLMVFAIDSWVSVYSAYMGLKTIREQRFLSPQERDLDKVRSKMCKQVEDNRHLLPNLNKSSRTTFISSFREIQSLQSPTDRVEGLYKFFTKDVSDQTNQPSRCTKIYEAYVKEYGYLCSIINIGTLSYIAWIGTDMLLHSLVANIVITALYLGSSLYMNLTAIPNTAVAIFNLFISLISCSYQPTLSDRLSPVLSIALKVFGLVTGALSFGISLKLSMDYFGKFLVIEIIMGVTLISATTFLVLMAILAITDKIVEFKIETLGTEEEKDLMKINKSMVLLKNALAECPHNELYKFIKTLPSETSQRLLQDTAIHLNNVEQLIEH